MSDQNPYTPPPASGDGQQSAGQPQYTGETQPYGTQPTTPYPSPSQNGQPGYGQGQPEQYAQPDKYGQQQYAQPQYAQQPYGQLPYGQQPPVGQVDSYGNPTASAGQYNPYGTYGQPAAQRTNTLAIVALILSLTVPIGGIVTGHIALGQIKRTGEAGHGLALAGMIIGYAYTALVVLAVIAYIVFFVAIFGAVGIGSSYGYDI